MFQIESNLSKFLNRFFQSKSLWNHKRISNTPSLNNVDPEKSRGKKDQGKSNGRFKEFNSSLCCQNSNISIGIVGGGLAAAYATALLKQNHLIKRIHLVDTTNTLDGAVADASFMDTSPKIKHYKNKFMRDALKDMDIIALLDECDFKMGKDTIIDQFMASVNYVRKTAEKIVHFCPSALLVIFARPVTATLPLVSEIYKCASRWDPNRIIGSVALEAMRAESFTARLADLNPAHLTVPLAGGADFCSTVPLISATRPINQFTKAHVDNLLHKFQNADKELASTESGGPILSSAAAIAKFLSTLTAGLNGHNKAIACAYVRSNTLPFCRFFTSELKFGPNGVEQNFGLPKVSPKEILLIEQSVNFINNYVDIALREAQKKTEVQASN